MLKSFNNGKLEVDVIKRNNIDFHVSSKSVRRGWNRKKTTCNNYEYSIANVEFKKKGHL